MLNTILLIIVIGGLCFALRRLGQIREELRHQSQLLSHTAGGHPLTPTVVVSKSLDSDMPPQPKMSGGIRADNPAIIK